MGVKTPDYYVTEQNLKLLRACVEANQPALLIGETGTGKTTIIREIAKEQDKELIRISVNGSMGVEEILGKWLVEKGSTKWQDGVLTDAIRKGHWVVMDEINAALPEILFTLHSLLDDDRKIVLPEKDNELVKPHKDFRFFATMNPPEEYAGTKDMNKALMSRFTAVLNVDVLEPAQEALLLEKKGASAAQAMRLVKAAVLLRNEKSKDNIYYFCSTRDLVQVVTLIKGGLKIKEAFNGAVVNKMSREEYNYVEKELDKTLKIDIDKKFKTVGDILKMAHFAEEEIEKVKKEHEEKVQDAIEKEREKIKSEAAESVSKEFLEKLTELSKKK